MFCFGIAVSRVLSSWLTAPSNVSIPAIQLQNERTCNEADTSPEVSTFFSEFREALRSKDTHKLFAMTRRCNFDWQADVPLLHPLQYEENPPAQLEAPFEVRPVLKASRGQRLIFQSENDFALNVQIIFSPRITSHLLQGNPQPGHECEYGVSWREGVLNHLCFERSSSGFKFIGLRSEP